MQVRRLLPVSLSFPKRTTDTESLVRTAVSLTLTVLCLDPLSPIHNDMAPLHHATSTPQYLLNNFGGLIQVL
jgi:hypothetical protein